MKKVLIFASILLAAPALAAPTAEKHALTLEGAKSVVAAAVAEARTRKSGGVFAIVDDGGNVMCVERLDGTFPAGANVAIGKARTAALFQRSTKFFEDLINQTRTAMVALPDFTPLQGGVPLVIDGRVVGAIGVSGAASAVADDEIATAAASSFGSAMTSGAGAMKSSEPHSDVTFFDTKEVKDAFAKGRPLLENGAFKIHASRRELPGQAEVHENETDIIYVLDGSATFVTGGAVAEGKMTGPGEIRGAAIQGGEPRKLVKGDVVVVPKGVPHWFREIEGPFLYYVVKVI